MDKTVEEIIESLDLDFSSWFDMWHTHVDWRSEGQDDWSVRQRFLAKLFAAYEYVNQKMIEHGRMYQSFCLIDLDDSGNDAVYVHTENPNKEDYPIEFEESDETFELESPLAEFIEAQGYDWRALKDSKTLVVYKEGLGEDLFKARCR